MKIISFAWTTPPLVAGAKTMTWRDWDSRYAQSFKAGELVQAWDKSQRIPGARQVAVIKLREAPQYLFSSELLDEDWEAEGLKWLHEHPEAWPKTLFGRPFDPWRVSRSGFDYFRSQNELGWVVRFDLVEVIEREVLR